MKTTADYLDELKSKDELGLKTDYAIAKALGTSTARISHYRVGRSRFDDETAVWVAEKLGISPFVVIAHMRAERAKDDAERNLWEKLAEKAMGIAPSLAGAVISAGSMYALFATSDTYGSAAAYSLYIMSNDEADAAALQAQLRELGIEVEVRLARDFQAALVEAERLTGDRRTHFKPRSGGERPYDRQRALDLETAA